jgi:hypothetical protein
MDSAEIKVYRITHIDNIPHILQKGITHRNSLNRNPDFIAIGDISLISARESKQITVDNGDFLNSQAPTIMLGDFIPFYFGVKMPMLYVIQNGGNFVTNSTPASKIVYMACAVSRLIKKQEKFYFSDGHATDRLTTFYDKTKIDGLLEIIDWKAVKASYWGGQENLDLKRKKQAEFLASQDVEANLITGFGCYDDDAKFKLIDLGINEGKIKVIPMAYY